MTDLTYFLTDSEDDFRSGCRNVSHIKQSFSGLHPPGWSYYFDKHPFTWVQTIHYNKIILVDVFVKSEPSKSHRVYAIIDDQSNASLISNELADSLGATGPSEKYFLSTCHSSNETKYGRRVSGLVARSVTDLRETDLPTLVECENIPDDKREIPTPEVARRFAHLESIADEILPLDPNAGVHILLGRDAPELLKVRAFRNGPRGAPWAQKLLLGWTVSGRICLDIANKPVHVKTRRTAIATDVTISKVSETNTHRRRESVQVEPCQNDFTVADRPTFDYAAGLEKDIFYSNPNDNDVSLSVEDRKFIDIMESEIHKNDQGNSEMPLPFRRQDHSMPDNKSQAMQRFRNLVKTLERKPQMKSDYLEFMGKIISKGHASPVPADETQATPGQVYGTYPTLGFTTPRNRHGFAWSSTLPQNTTAFPLTRSFSLAQI